MPKKKSINNEDLVEDMLQQLPSNSQASKRVAPIREVTLDVDETAFVEEKDARTPRAVVRKKSFAQSIAQTFLGQEAKGMVQYVLQDVLIPAAKNTIQEMVQSGIEMLLFGETRPSGRNRDKGKTIVSYGSFYKDRDERRDPRHRGSSRDKFGLEDIYFPTPKEANDVLSELCDQLEEYEWVTVADYFDIAGIDGASWIHSKWGWDNLKRSKCIHTRGGYQVVLPEPEEVG